MRTPPLLTIALLAAACSDVAPPADEPCGDGVLEPGELCFEAVTTIEAEGGPMAIASGDFDGDGHLDLATANATAREVQVFRADGAGAFEAAVGFGVHADPVALELADLDGDGDLDIVAGLRYGASLDVLLGDGQGSFAAAQVHVLGSPPDTYFEITDLVIADLDGDGLPDVAAGGWGKPSLWSFRGLGDGSFALAQPLVDLEDSAHELGAGDLDGDGAIDLVGATHLGLGHVTAYINDGSGSFNAEPAIAVGAQPASPTIVDVDGDGVLDLVTASSGVDDITILRGQGDGTFVHALNVSLQQGGIGNNRGPSSVSVVDLDGDHDVDLVATNRTADSLSVFTQTSADPLAFEERLVLAVGINPTASAVADFDHDGAPDILAVATGTHEDWLRPDSVWPGGSLSLVLSNP